MTKKTVTRIVILAVLLALFSLLAFTSSIWRTKKFWLAYLCGVFAILFMVYALTATAGKEDTKQRFYGFPTVRLGRYYLMLQGIASVVEITTGMSGWGMLAINGPLLAFPVIGFITTRTVRSEIARQDAKRKKADAAV